MTINDVANFILVFGAYPASIIFWVVFTVTRSPWWRDPLGWVIWGLATATVLVFSVSFAFLVFGPDYWGRDWFKLIAYAALTLAFFAKAWAVIHERRKGRTNEGEAMSDHKVAEVTPIWFPWQRVKRVLVVLLFTVVPTLNVAVPQIVEAFNGYVSPELFAIINTVAVGILVVAGIITRILAIPAVNEFLVWVGIGSVPKSALPQ